jgi:hypothetical protein
MTYKRRIRKMRKKKKDTHIYTHSHTRKDDLHHQQCLYRRPSGTDLTHTKARHRIYVASIMAEEYAWIRFRRPEDGKGTRTPDAPEIARVGFEKDVRHFRGGDTK